MCPALVVVTKAGVPRGSASGLEAYYAQLRAQNGELRAEIAQLRDQVVALTARIAELEHRVAPAGRPNEQGNGWVTARRRTRALHDTLAEFDPTAAGRNRVASLGDWEAPASTASRLRDKAT
jgi:hypothetical protein